MIDMTNVRVWTKLIASIGVSAGLLVYVVIWLTTRVEAGMDRHNTGMDAHNKEMSALATSFHLYMRSQEMHNRDALRILMAMCYNEAGVNENKQLRCEGRR